MSNNKDMKERDNTIAEIVLKEIERPRMSKSARIAELNLDTSRIPESPSTTLAGTVDEILPSSLPSQPEKAQIGVYGADSGYSDLRIENTFTDEHGDDVRLKKGAHVEITFTAKDLDHN
jgi:hypothetical protein